MKHCSIQLLKIYCNFWKFTCEVLPMENVYKAFDEIPKILCTIETEMLDLVDFVALPSECMCNISPNHNVFDIHVRLLTSIVRLEPFCVE